MRSGIAKYTPLLWILAIPVLNVFYGILNHVDSNTINLVTDLDGQIPFVPGFIVPYLLWYPFIFGLLIIFCMHNRKVYYRTLSAICAGLIVSYIIYYFYQTTVTRPPITDEGLMYSLVQLVYQTDQPYNCFPSIHVLTSYLVMKGILDCTNQSKIVRFMVVITSWSIIFSTLFVKQHVVLDVIGAILLGKLLYYIIGKCMQSHYLQMLLRVDKRLFYWCNQTLNRAILDRFFGIITHTGGAICTIFLSLSLVIFASGLWQTVGFESLAALSISHLVVAIIKKKIPRTRPFLALSQVKVGSNPLFDSSFPSGHTTAIFSVITPILFVTGSVSIVLLLLAIMVGLSRIYLGLHYPSDILAGSLLGIVTGFFMVILI